MCDETISHGTLSLLPPLICPLCSGEMLIDPRSFGETCYHGESSYRRMRCLFCGENIYLVDYGPEDVEYTHDLAEALRLCEKRPVCDP